MCKYCERQKYIEDQPLFRGFLYTTIANGDRITGHTTRNDARWGVKIKDYQTHQPEMTVLSDDGIDCLHVPIQYCPFCGERLGTDDVQRMIEIIHKKTGLQNSCVGSDKSDFVVFYEPEKGKWVVSYVKECDSDLNPKIKSEHEVLMYAAEEFIVKYKEYKND